MGHAEPVYASAACQMIIARQAARPEAARRHSVKTQCREMAARKAAARHKENALREQAQHEAAEEAALWQALEPLDASLLRFVIPTGPAREVRLSRTRRQRYTEHVQQIITEASMRPAPLPQAQFEPRGLGSVLLFPSIHLSTCRR